MRGLYLKYSLWEFVLVLAAALALTYTLLNGFYVSPDLQYSVVPAVVVAVCLVALYAVASSRRTLVPGGIAFGVALVVVWVVAAVLTPGGAVFVDSETNYLIFAMVVTIVPTACFLLARTRVGAALQFIAGAFLIALIQLFYERFELVWTLLFVAAALTLIIYKNYQQSVKSAMGVEKVSFAPGFTVALAAALVAVGLGVGVWFAAIAPLNPDAIDIKLVTEYRALETVQVRGTSDVYQTPNIDMTSDVTNDGERTTDDIKEDLNGMPWPATGEADSEAEQEEQSNSSFLGMNLDSLQDAFDFQSNPQNWPLLVILILIIALIVAFFVLRRVRRNKRLERFRALGPDEEFEQVFLFLVSRLARLGVNVPTGQTIREFGVSSEAALRFQDAEANAHFHDLACAYSDLVYGKCSVDSDAVSSIERYYQGFWKACRKQLGNVKYFFKSFRL